MKRPLIVGYGNPLRGDDGVGRRAAELVEEAIGDAADVVVCQQLTPELAARVGEASLAVFLDASTEQQPGEVREQSVRLADASRFTHSLTPAQLCGLAHCIGGDVPSAVLLTCGAADTHAVVGLTPPAERGAKEMAARAVRLVRASNADASLRDIAHE